MASILENTGLLVPTFLLCWCVWGWGVWCANTTPPSTAKQWIQCMDTKEFLVAFRDKRNLPKSSISGKLIDVLPGGVALFQWHRKNRRLSKRSLIFCFSNWNLTFSHTTSSTVLESDFFDFYFTDLLIFIHARTNKHNLFWDLKFVSSRGFVSLLFRDGLKSWWRCGVSKAN